MKASDYRMDTVMAFKIRVAGMQMLFEHCLNPEKALPVDILFLEPYAGLKRSSQQHYASIIQNFCPAVVIPVHADDMMMPLLKPVAGQMLPQRKFFFPLGRFNFQEFKQTIEAMRPQTRVFLPNRLEEYGLKEILAGSHLRGWVLPSTSSIKIGLLHFALRNLAFLRRRFESKIPSCRIKQRSVTARCLLTN